MDMKPIGSAIKHARKQAGIRTADLASHIGITPAYVQQIERGAATPNLKRFVDIINEIGVSADTVLQSQLTCCHDKIILEADTIRKEMHDLSLHLTDEQCRIVIDLMKSIQKHM